MLRVTTIVSNNLALRIGAIDQWLPSKSQLARAELVVAIGTP
jgi:hypothetical protein